MEYVWIFPKGMGLGDQVFFFSMIDLIGDISAGCQGMWYKPLLGGVTVPWSSRLIRTWYLVQGKCLQKGPLWKIRGLLCNGFKGAVRTKIHIVYGTFKVNASKTTQREHDGKPYKHSCLTLPLCTLCVVSEASTLEVLYTCSIWTHTNWLFF